jgi:hypothetical protein
MPKSRDLKCVVCGDHVMVRYKAMPEWNIEGDLCGKCYEKKLADHYLSCH